MINSPLTPRRTNLILQFPRTSRWQQSLQNLTYMCCSCHMDLSRTHLWLEVLVSACLFCCELSNMIGSSWAALCNTDVKGSEQFYNPMFLAVWKQELNQMMKRLELGHEEGLGLYNVPKNSQDFFACVDAPCMSKCPLFFPTKVIWIHSTYLSNFEFDEEW